MKKLWRRIRGAVGMGITWALGWAPVGAVVSAALWLALSPPVALWPVLSANALTFGVLGFVGGTLFSTLLGLAEGRRSFHELSIRRFAALGAVGGFLLGGFALWAGFWGAGGLPALAIAVAAGATALGSASAAGTLALARRAESLELPGAASVGTLENSGH